MTRQALHNLDNIDDIRTLLQPYGDIIFCPALNIEDLEHEAINGNDELIHQNFEEKHYDNKKTKRIRR